MGPGDVLLKSRRTLHEDVFGDDGAVLLALEFLDEEHAFEPCLWRRRRDAYALRHACALLDAALAGDCEAVGAAGADLLAPSPPQQRRMPPAWLEHLRCELEQSALSTVSIAAHARAAGAHVSHVSRLFRRCYGASITEHAQAHSVRRAIGPLARPEIPLREVALEAGFYDQSHMTRVFRRITGRTPGAHRALMAAAC
jgi:AraC family transcriptional regulator